MILIGQYDSPFVRRVAVALQLWGLAYRHEPWSTFGDADRIARYNPLRRVPTLVLDDGTVLVDSFAILDSLDERVGPERALIARSGPDRREALRISALAAGAADKAVALVYERVLRDAPLEAWTRRCRAQVGETLALLERERAARPGPYWFGEAIGHADIALAALLRFVSEALPGAFSLDAFPALAAHSTRCEALDAFRAVHQPFRGPPGG
jgi:glutathione S-transferase